MPDKGTQESIFNNTDLPKHTGAYKHMHVCACVENNPGK